MSYITDYAYYENSGNSPESANWGSYQYVPLLDIVNNFLLMYAGNDTVFGKVDRYKVLFHAKRAVQELNYDAFKEIKILQLDLCDELRFVLPQDYVNWVRISWYKGGLLYPLTENIQTLWSDAYLQDNNCDILFDEDGYVLKPEFSNFDLDRIDGAKKSIYLNDNSPYNGQEGYLIDGSWYFTHGIGSRIGLETEVANANPTFSIDRKGGAIHFSSDMSGESIIIEYVSDGMEAGDDSKVSVNKMFEKYVYAYIAYELLMTRMGVQEYVIRRYKNEKQKELANARIRISDIHPGKLLMSLRAQHKWIK